MPYTSRGYGMVPMPQAPDPMQSITGLMNMANNLEEAKAQQKERARATRVEAAFNEAKGDPIKAAEVLETKHGDFATARGIRDNAQQIRLKAVEQMGERLNQHKTIYGQASQALTELQTDPTMYPAVRPKLLELASAVDPRLAQEIPEQYSHETVKGMMDFTAQAAAMADSRSRAAALLADRLKTKEADIKDEEGDRKVVSDWFSVSPNQDDWNQSLDHARAVGVSESVLKQVGPTWSKEAQERARQMGLTPDQREVKKPATIAAAILDARSRGDAAGEASLVKLQGTLNAAGRAPSTDTPVTADMINAVRANPSLWGDLTPTVRDKMLAPLQQGGFDFKAATSGMTDVQRAAIERWKTTALEALERDYNANKPFGPDDKFGMSEAELATRKLTIENSYRAQIGMPPLTELPASWRKPGDRGEAQPKPAPAAAPARTGGPGAATTGTVAMHAPDGRQLAVPADQVDAMLKLGATKDR